MRIATYNFLSGGSHTRNTHWQRLRRELRPDLLFAQECRPFAVRGAQRLLFAPATSRGWGTALLVRTTDAQLLRVPGFGGWVIGAELTDARWCGDRPIRAFSIHCPAGAGGYVRVMHRILDKIAKFSRNADVIIGGDLNVATGYRDSGDLVRMSAGERSLLDRITGELALIPAWQSIHPGAQLAQTLRWSANHATPYHCDGIFIPESWRCNLRSCDVIVDDGWIALSDHNPVLAVIDKGRRHARVEA